MHGTAKIWLLAALSSTFIALFVIKMVVAMAEAVMVMFWLLELAAQA